LGWKNAPKIAEICRHTLNIVHSCYAPRGKRLREIVFLQKSNASLNPMQDTPHYILGFIQLQMGWTEKAAESFSTVLAINPTHRDAKDLLVKIRGPDEI